MADFPKKQQQCLIPKYLLDYTTELNKNHPDPTDPWGGSGGDVNIEAGTGITITTESDDTKVISLDTNPDVFEITADTGMTLEVENENPLWTDAKLQMAYTGATRLEGTLIDLYASNGMYFHSDYAPYYVNNTTHEYKTLATTDQLFSGDYDDLYNKPTIPDAVSGTNDGTNWTSLTIGEDTYGLASGGGTSYTAGNGINITGATISIDTSVVAEISDIPTDVSELNNDAGYITGITSSDVTTALGYTPYNSSNPDGYITGINSSDVITALGYTPGTSNFSGSYNDLTNKPTIPTVNDPTITFTQGGVTKGTITLNQSYNQTIALDAGGSGGTENMIDIGPITTSTFNLTADQLSAVEDGASINLTLAYPLVALTQSYVFHPWTYDDTLYSYYVYRNYSIDPAVGSLGPSVFIRELRITTQGACTYAYQTINLSKVASTGDYADLTNKPTIPTVNDNTITITQGGVTKGSFTLNQNTNQTINVDDVPGMIGEVIFSNASGSTDLTLTMAHSFADYEYVDIQYCDNASADSVSTTRIYEPNGKTVHLQALQCNTTPRTYFKTARYDLSGTTMTQAYKVQTRIGNNEATTVAYNAADTVSGLVKITKVIGYKQNSAPIVIPSVPTFTTLFNDSNGSDALSITLSDSVANYNCLDIQWVNNDGISNSTRVYDPNGKRISVINMYGYNPGNPEYINKAGIYDLSGTSMTQVCKVQGTIRNNASSGVDYKSSSTVDAIIKITKVVGIKY